MRYFTVGPSQLHPRFQVFLDQALASDIPSLSHRSEKFCQLFEELSDNVKTLMRFDTSGTVFYSGSATEWMERTIQNMSTHDTLHFVSGTFARRWQTVAEELGRNTIIVAQKSDGSFSLDDIPEDTSPELICMTHNETNNGTMLNEQFFRAVRERFPTSLIAVDVVSSAPVHQDIFGTADALFFSVQKCFGLPAGLGVILVNSNAIATARAHATSQYTGSFHSFSNLADEAAKRRTPETPNVLNMYLLNEVIKDYSLRGIDTLQKETDEKARLLYQAIEKTSELSPSVPDGPYRSHTTIVADAKRGSSDIIARLKSVGMTIGSGYGKEKESKIRIANFPTLDMKDIEALADSLSIS